MILFTILQIIYLLIVDDKNLIFIIVLTPVSWEIFVWHVVLSLVFVISNMLQSSEIC